MANYIIKHFPENLQCSLKEAVNLKYLFYKDKLYKQMYLFSNKHPYEYTYIMSLNDQEKFTKHVKWEEVEAAIPYLCSDDETGINQIKRIPIKNNYFDEGQKFNSEEIKNL